MIKHNHTEEERQRLIAAIKGTLKATVKRFTTVGYEKQGVIDKLPIYRTVVKVTIESNNLDIILKLLGYLYELEVLKADNIESYERFVIVFRDICFKKKEREQEQGNLSTSDIEDIVSKYQKEHQLDLIEILEL